MFDSRVLLCIFASTQLMVAAIDAAESPWRAGFSRVDVTPTEPVRMAGYGNRDHPNVGIDTPLFVRCVAIEHQGSGDQPFLLVTVDTIGIPGSLTHKLTAAITKKHDVPRERIVICSTHTHCGPDLISELSNIFKTPLTEKEVAAGTRYKSKLTAAILRSVDIAIADMNPALLHYEVGEASFAVNRRLVQNGKWTGFGIQTDGPVDHTVPLIRITDPQENLCGVVFNYACHGTTLGGRHYNINAEWSGYACNHIESKYEGVTALCTIGCGADANPNPRDSIDAAKVHGRTLGAEVLRLAGGPMQAIDASVSAAFDYSALSFDLPTKEELQKIVDEAGSSSRLPQEIRHAKHLLEVYDRKGRLPATYPVPIQAWKFGEQLTMIFLGGEVVVDYALRLKRQLRDPKLWVTAYANDVLGYIASERVRREGGYEVDRSGVYYSLPGRWATGTEEALIRSIEELLKFRREARPLPADDALRSIKVSDGFRVQLVASEPLVRDPINIAFGNDGKLWVVEMGDYPESENGGRVKTLIDTNGDGSFDQANVFMADIAFPTGVFPWKDGVLITAAPDVLFARDTDGDGAADDVKKLYTGFRLANPQHRINGFTYGLDHSLHLASGDNLGDVSSVLTSETVNASGHDVQIWPDEGRIAVTSGRTQFVRSRNDWGQWFGNDNSRPMYHFPISERHLRRNPSASYSENAQQLFNPPSAPHVFPQTDATQRFNDLFASNRFTSACSAVVARAPHFGHAPNEVAFVCEPVHNLVHRCKLVPSGASFAARRIQSESQSEFLSSDDPWFRPVRAIVSPDGALWIVDMYRQTIEHPKWIPESWQNQLDIRAGSDRGRIYRITADEKNSNGLRTDLSEYTTGDLVAELRSPIGTRRDMIQQMIIERRDANAYEPLMKLAMASDVPHARVHALSILNHFSRLTDDVLIAALQDRHPGVLIVAIRLAESRIDQSPGIIDALDRVAGHDDMRVVLSAALALGESGQQRAGRILGKISCRRDLDRWTARAIGSSAKNHSVVILRAMLDRQPDELSESNDTTKKLIVDLLATAQDSGVDIVKEFSSVAFDPSKDLARRVELASCFCHAVRRKGKQSGSVSGFRDLYNDAKGLIVDPNRPDKQRCQAMELTGLGIDSVDAERAFLIDLIVPTNSVAVQAQAIDCMIRIDPESSSREIFARWPSLTKMIREHFASTMMRRHETVTTLIGALEAGQIQVNDLTPAHRQHLTKTGSRSMRVRAERVLRTAGSMNKTELVHAYVSELDGTGDEKTGAALFKQHCAVCHLPDERGQVVGASLDNLTDRSDMTLLTAILDPNRAVDPKYQTYVIETNDGRILSGAIENEVGSSMSIVHADGKRSVLGRDEIADIKNTSISLMPEGMESVLSHQAMRDLLAYLQKSPSR